MQWPLFHIQSLTWLNEGRDLPNDWAAALAVAANLPDRDGWVRAAMRERWTPEQFAEHVRAAAGSGAPAPVDPIGDVHALVLLYRRRHALPADAELKISIPSPVAKRLGEQLAAELSEMLAAIESTTDDDPPSAAPGP